MRFWRESTKQREGAEHWYGNVHSEVRQGSQHRDWGREVEWGSGESRGQQHLGIQGFPEEWSGWLCFCMLLGGWITFDRKVSTGFDNKKAVSGLWKINLVWKPNDTMWKSKWEVTNWKQYTDDSLKNSGYGMEKWVTAAFCFVWKMRDTSVCF